MARAQRDAVERHGAGWPADPAAIEAARQFIRECASGGPVAVACDSDVDGLSAAVIVERAVSTAGCEVAVLPARRGEHVHTASMQTRILGLRPTRLVVLDMGSRPEPILPGIPTLLVDHHHAAAGTPPGALVVSGYDRPPVAPTSVLAYAICRSFDRMEGTAWLGALGAVADLGSAAAFAELLGIRAGSRAWKDAAALLNAARRAASPDPGIALGMLRDAREIGDITSGALTGTAILQRMRQEVRSEADRCARVAPAMAGDVAVIRFASGAQVHPLVAVRWAQRLRPRIVLAANDGYIAGRTNFAVRCAADLDLVAWLRGLPFVPSPGAEYAHGHARATGGSLASADFERFLSAVTSSRGEPATPT